MGTRRQQQNRILEALEEHGWRRLSVERNCDFWADEIWSLSSTGSPEGFKAWMAFLVDPQWEGSRAAGEGVCAIAADIVRRADRTGWLVQIPLGRRWERGLAELLEALRSARVAGSHAVKKAGLPSESRG